MKEKNGEGAGRPYQTLEPEGEDLGYRMGQFGSRSDISRTLLPVALILFGLLCGLFWFRNRQNLEGGMLVFILMGLFFIIQGIRLALQNHGEGDWQVLAFEEGMLLTYNGEKKVLRWSDIASLELEPEKGFTFSLGSWEDSNDGIPILSYQSFTIWMRNGDRYTFGGVEIKALGELLQSKIK